VQRAISLMQKTNGLQNKRTLVVARSNRRYKPLYKEVAQRKDRRPELWLMNLKRNDM